MEQRMKAIGQKGTKTEKYVPVGRTGLVRPRRPLEDRNSYLGKVSLLHSVTGTNIVLFRSLLFLQKLYYKVK